jgi:hypothetical protein
VIAIFREQALPYMAERAAKLETTSNCAPTTGRACGWGHARTNVRDAQTRHCLVPGSGNMSRTRSQASPSLSARPENASSSEYSSVTTRPGRSTVQSTEPRRSTIAERSASGRARPSAWSRPPPGRWRRRDPW